MLVGNGRARKQRRGKKLESIYFRYGILRGFSGGTSGKEPAFQYRRQKRRGSILGWGRAHGGGHGNPL